MYLHTENEALAFRSSRLKMSNFGPMNSNIFPLLFSVIFSLPFTATSHSDPTCTPINPGPVVPPNSLVSFLESLQETALNTYGSTNFDPKLYVDLSLKFNLSSTKEAFEKLPKTANGLVSKSTLDGFIKSHLNDAEEDIEYKVPADFVPEPEGFLPAVESPKMRAWALQVHSLWKNLSRKVADAVFEQKGFHTLLPLPNPVIIPGSRFREVYYWDSYWVIRGLLASKMYETAKGIVTNLVSLLDKYGHVLNGARLYYINRSQPPLLSSMVYEIYMRTGDKKFANKCLGALIKEHQFWNAEIHRVVIHDAKGRSHTLNRYYARWNKPRPESGTTDKATASKLSNANAKQRLYRELASTAESGWDFSTRWMRNSSDLTTLATTSILPVDLNSYILKMELDIAFLANATGHPTTAVHYIKAAQARKKAINSIFWNEKMGQWVDYWLSNKTKCKDGQSWKAMNQNQNIFASNFIPLWIKLFNSDTKLVEKVMLSFQKSGLLQAVGIATSLTNSGQQWDFPNGWAPIQHMIVEGLSRSGSKEARALAESIVVRWIRTNYVTFKKSGVMHEKYDVEKCGEFGGGGEYVPQTGFGWSNGVVLAFLEEFGWPKDLKMEC
ncbi:Alpha,alpha-trehalase [Bertholletia excelsa]